MCNICVNSLCFVSRDLSKLKDLHSKIKVIADNKTDNSVTKLLETYDYNQAETTLLVDRRDYFSDVDKAITQKGPVYYFMAETCSSWNENLLGFYTLLEEKYNNSIRMYHQSEEDGQNIYTVYDPTGIFFYNRYKIDMCTNNNEYITEYYSNYAEVISMLEIYFPNCSLSVFESPVDVEAQIQETLTPDSDAFFKLHVFKPYNANSYNRYYFKEVA